ncbi:ubiquinone biosynthesis accessory factor UbiJ [Celerinatantimonas diazotrophica]|uniref:Ubiquinone biosynthesis accessory factor UbiJ n=1 Tax=Celerinatantimonas diazotrophica TaxID=412034 RepID=A0A4R1KH15_9GAMM|nr:SCP2 sterol-binding domain-containing protein [Celerinatantimonas diazotrophica]TCK63363.1 ubiquinone biosynthesis protein UbiJ [Celerinatantimonas diazotrophica]CAG9294907.1 Ubiquinone biosynthesis accessory factor UbiJ [Celerinatantimonas diazotrophica]
MPFAPLMSACLELVSNHYLSLDEHSSKRLSKLNGRVVAVRITPLPIIYFSIESHQLDILNHFEGQPDSQLTASALSSLKLRDPNSLPELIKSGEVELTGDIRLIQQFAALFSDVQPDFEQRLSLLIGDVPAHLLVQQVHKLVAMVRQSSAQSVARGADLAIEEWRIGVGKTQFNDFAGDISALKSQLDQFEARLKQLADQYGN